MLLRNIRFGEVRMNNKKLNELERRINKLEEFIAPDITPKGKVRTNNKENKLTLDLDELMVTHNKRYKKGVVFSGMAIPNNTDNKDRLVRWSCSGGFKTDQEFNNFIDHASASDVSNFCNCFSSEEKLLIIRSLIKSGGMSQRDVLKSTGISQGQFYHHIKDLISYGLIVKDRSVYDLSPMGHVLSISFTGIINTFIK